MLLLGILLSLCLRGVIPSSSPLPLSAVDCLDAERDCQADLRCRELYRTLARCTSEDVRLECQEALSGLHNYLPLLACQCYRGARREDHCLNVYWTVRLYQGYDPEETPYAEFPGELSPMASIVAEASSLPLDGQNVCLKAAQDCGLYEKCGALRSEYVLACTKRLPGSDHCHRQKCHRALRRFLERVPVEYSLGVLFCPCTDRLCGERRRKTIVPSCSYQEKDGIQPNCLHLQSFCRKENLCRSRLVDFQHNCQPSSLSPNGCVREAGAACLKSYAGLIGTIMTPNYVSNSSVGVALWCTCDGSGNQWQDCLRIQHMFTKNRCLENSISSMGSSAPRPAEGTPPSPPPSALDQQDNLRLNTHHNPHHELRNNAVEQSEEDLDVPEDHDKFDVISLYAEKATVSNLGSGGGVASPRLSPAPPPSLLVLLLLLSAFLSWW